MIIIKNVVLDAKTGKLTYVEASKEQMENISKEGLEREKAEQLAKDIANSEFELKLISKLAEWGVI